MDKIKKGESINQIAGQIAGNKAVDGSMDWILPNQVVPEISNVMVNLSKGSVCAAPIFVNGTWHIIKVDDKRSYKLPTFEESKNNVRAGLIQKKQADLIVQLRKSAKIQ
jgi:peptidyl-prolyl cis-trans isomerase C